VPSGASGGSWSASVYPQSNLPFGIVGTPGSATIIRITYAETPISQALIINEIGNSDTDAYDWVEIHNPGTAAVNIRSMMFTTVTNTGTAAAPVGKEEILFKFPNADLNIPAKHYVVFAASDPENAGNDLAAGINILKSDIDQRNKGLGSKVGIGHQSNNTTAFYRIHSAVRLPDDARHRLYILRKGSNDAAHDNRIGSHPEAQKNVVDVIGSLAIQLRNRTPAGWTGANEEERGRTDTGEARVRRIFDTTMWPLQWAVVDPGKKHPHGKRVDGGAPALGSNKVYHRNGKGLPNAENHLTTPGYTGVGYDRHAEVNAENHGTPGYANNAVKGDKSAWNMQVSISEIMLATHEKEDNAARIPRAIRLPQWIEIYNNSLTEGVNIGNWYLEIRNADSEDLITRDLHGTLQLPSVIIPPNQTVLIVSSSGLSSPDFPQQRVINLFTTPKAREVFSLVNRNDPVLSQVGFYIQLRDHKNNYVDEIGNLPPTSRRGIEARGAANFEPVWDLPDMNHPDGPRTSLIRVYDAGKPNDGLMKVAELQGGMDGGDPNIGWRRAVDTTFRNVPTLTYYGNQRDYGTPGYRGGGPLPVSLSKFRPERLDDGSVVIRWVTESELNNAGFNILRSDTRNGEFTKVNTQLIKGQGTTSERSTYEWKDTTAKPNVVYYYQIQDVSIDGKVQTLQVSRLKGNVSPAGKLPTIWGEIKALQ
ncbi:MAG: lamin tail domain-containing protein, partial [Proteobacteria bacterium]|nr:lamin tail domain-containing protein [Pseudomonadota bacterium]